MREAGEQQFTDRLWTALRDRRAAVSTGVEAICSSCGGRFRLPGRRPPLRPHGQDHATLAVIPDSCFAGI